LRDRLTVARDLLTESGSIFVQIGDENVHRVRALMDEVFGNDSCVNQITFLKTSSSTSDFLGNVADYLLWYCKKKESLKFREPFYSKELGNGAFEAYNKILLPDGSISAASALPENEHADGDIIRFDNITSQSVGRDKGEGAASWFPVRISGREITPNIKVRWKTNELGMSRLMKAGRLSPAKNSLNYLRKLKDFTAVARHHIWTDTIISGSSLEKNYVVETLPFVVQRCILMTTDPGDLVLDPTCGSGTSAYVAEQWGRRWITIDTSRVALALARVRVMGARYPYYLLADSRDGQVKEGQITGRVPSDAPTRGDIRQGFVYERIPHIMLSSIANNSEIDVIWDEYQIVLELLREKLNAALKKNWQEWEIPREP
jgi:adenine-specific DNA-methyltransferase